MLPRIIYNKNWYEKEAIILHGPNCIEYYRVLQNLLFLYRSKKKKNGLLTFISVVNLTLLSLKCAVGPSGKCEITRPSI